MDKIRNDDIRNELNIFNLKERIKNNRRRWKEHAERIDENWLPIKALNIKVEEDEVKVDR